MRLAGQSDPRVGRLRVTARPAHRAARRAPSSAWPRSTPRWSRARSRAAGWTRTWARPGRCWPSSRAEQEAAREQRVHWQVQEAHVAGGLRSAEERLARAEAMRSEAEAAGSSPGQRAGAARRRRGRARCGSRREWREARAEREIALHRAGERQRRRGSRPRERGVGPSRRPSARWSTSRATLESGNEESHVLQVRLTEAAGDPQEHRRAGRGGVAPALRSAHGRRADARSRPRDPAGRVRPHHRVARVHRSGECAGGRGARRRGEAAPVPHQPSGTTWWARASR